VVEAAPLDLEDRAELPWTASTPAPAVSLVRALKSQWDPALILNPGRMAS
jgi:hypothetical protein